MSIGTVESVAIAAVELGDGKVDHTTAAESHGQVKLVQRKLIQWDRNRNPRLASKYSVEKIGWLARNIYDNGLLEPLVLSKRANGELWGLKGHLRSAAIEIIVNEGLPEVKSTKETAAKPAVPPSPDFMTKVRCIVYEGLSLVDELDLVMDHGTSTPLDRREKYRAIKTMALAGFTQQLIADKMKQSRSMVSKMVWIGSMPQCVEDAFLSDEKDAPDLNDPTITKLYTEYNADKADGCRIKTAGPKFSAVWEKFVAEGKQKRTKALTSTDLVSMAERYNDVDLQDLLLAISNGSSEKAADAIARLTLRLAPVGCTPLGGLESSHRIIEEGVTRNVIE